MVFWEDYSVGVVGMSSGCFADDVYVFWMVWGYYIVNLRSNLLFNNILDYFVLVRVKLALI